MSKKENIAKKQYVYFSGSEETVIRSDETKKKEITKLIKRKKAKKIAINVISVILIITIIVSATFLGKRGIEQFLVLRQEQQKQQNAALPDDVINKLDNMTEEQKWAYLYEKYP